MPSNDTILVELSREDAVTWLEDRAGDQRTGAERRIGKAVADALDAPSPEQVGRRFTVSEIRDRLHDTDAMCELFGWDPIAGGNWSQEDRNNLERAIDTAFPSPEPKDTAPERSVAEISEWVRERRDHEYRNRPAPEHGNTVASGMTMGAIEVLDALNDYLNGDDDA